MGTVEMVEHHPSGELRGEIAGHAAGMVEAAALVGRYGCNVVSVEPFDSGQTYAVTVTPSGTPSTLAVEWIGGDDIERLEWITLYRRIQGGGWLRSGDYAVPPPMAPDQRGDTEAAAVAVLAADDGLECTADSSRGASMGRVDELGRFDTRGPGRPWATVRRIGLDEGGYDNGGAYWGHGAPLWGIAANHSAGGTPAPAPARLYVRARYYADAVEYARQRLPGVVIDGEGKQ